MFGKYTYNGTIKKTIAVFGSMFNDIHIARTSADQLSRDISKVERVPLSYAPRKQFLARVYEDPDSTDIAVKLPRMAFELVSAEPDNTTGLNILNKTQVLTESGAVPVHEGAPYNLTLELNIAGKDLDTTHQILEQILPYFRPNLSVVVKDLEYPGSKTTVPFTLTGFSPNDEYTGELENSRRTIVYTLTFKVRVVFTAFSDANSLPLIRTVYVDTVDMNTETGTTTKLSVGADDTPDEYTITYEEFDYEERTEPN